ncbi:MAG: DUF3109 domain-containing protein [Bacteroidetes bacterium HGW-Bacteroidetes-11]|jgi:hypothetical protein|nr:MAG: DUF3109 domain-containing protein [Bacteroidetes bacterium HGW-Bacteroidetes-11]
MIAIDNTLNSDDLHKVCFVCDLKKCKGACCVEGDAGAPLEEHEISELEDNLDRIKPFMRPDGIRAVEQMGVFDFDAHGHYVTPLINGAECAFVVFDDEGIAACAIEKAWEAGASHFRKPVSCHLYPVRISKYNDFDAVNYHEWHICRPALEFGKKLNVPMYVFLKDSLIRKYGEKWYKDLTVSIVAKTGRK